MISSLMLIVHGVSGLVTLLVELALKDMSAILMVTYRYDVCMRVCVCLCVFVCRLSMVAYNIGLVSYKVPGLMYSHCCFLE